ncbi:MAG: heparinase II/III family protein [Planctomycetota bacterium]|nr:heparinase II/III family protein [Planctomycetota bacterium]
MPEPRSLFGQALLERKHAPGLEFFREHLRARCEAIRTPGSRYHLDWRACELPIWKQRMGCRAIPAALEQFSFAAVLLDEAHAAHARDLFMTLVDRRIDEEMETLNPHGVLHKGWRHTPLDAGASSVALGLAFDALHPFLAAAERVKIGAWLRPFIEYLFEHAPDPDELKPEWNIASTATTGLALLALALHDAGLLDEARCERAQRMALHRAKVLLGRCVDAGGALFEGPCYGASALEYVAAYAYARARLGDRELLGHPAWALAVRGLVHELVPATGVPNHLNDCNEPHALPWLALAASSARDGLAQWLWQRMTNFPEAPRIQPDERDVWRAFETRYLLYCDPALKPVPPREAGLPLRMRFPERDLVDLRTGWDRDDAFLSFVCDHSPRGGHRQADRGHFAFHALGEAFAVDTGYGKVAVHGAGTLRMGALGEAHNLPLIHGEMQHEMPAPGGIRKLDLDAEIPRVEAEIGASWRSLNRFTRRLAWLPGAPGEAPFLLVADLAEWDAEGPVLTSWLLHTHARNSAEFDGPQAVLTGGNAGQRCLVRMLAPGIGHWRQEAFLGHPRLRYDRIAQPLLALVLLAPFKAGAEPPRVETHAEPEGCALRVRNGPHAYAAALALPGRSLEWNGMKTDGEFSVKIER